MKAWLGDESVEPISPLCGICGVDDPLNQGMELEADEEKGELFWNEKMPIELAKKMNRR